MANYKNVNAGQFRFETDYHGFLYGKKQVTFSFKEILLRKILFSRFRFYFLQCRLFGAFQQWFHGWSDEDMSKQTAVLLVFQESHQDVKMIVHSQMFYWEDHNLTVPCHQERVQTSLKRYVNVRRFSGLVRYEGTSLNSLKVCNAANNSSCGLMEYYDRRKNCIQIFVKDESLSPG